MSTVPARRVAGLLDHRTRGVLVSASRDPDAKLTFVTTGDDRLAVKLATTVAAGPAVEREGRMLVELRRMPLGRLARTIPRYVESSRRDGRAVLVSSALPGTPMSVGYHQWLHTARPQQVGCDFTLAGGWLHELQGATTGGRAPLTWAAEVAETLAGRWDGHPSLDAALARLRFAHRHLGAHTAVSTAVHGDFWCGNVLVADGAVSGVVDWEAGVTSGFPLRDPARFALSYALYLDRHTRPGHRVLGHPGLRRTGFGPGIGYALQGTGWLPTLVRSFLAESLTRLGLPPALWYDVALTGIGEVAACANDDAFGAGHLELLAGLPVHPRRPRQRRG
jgi:hypothetical protein